MVQFTGKNWCVSECGAEFLQRTVQPPVRYNSQQKVEGVTLDTRHTPLALLRGKKNPSRPGLTTGFKSYRFICRTRTTLHMMPILQPLQQSWPWQTVPGTNSTSSSSSWHTAIHSSVIKFDSCAYSQPSSVCVTKVRTQNLDNGRLSLLKRISMNKEAPENMQRKKDEIEPWKPHLWAFFTGRA